MSNENTGRFFICGEHSEIREASNDEIVTAAREIMNRKIRRGTSMASPKLVKDFLSVKLGSLEHETFCVMLLDKRHRLIEFVELFRGTIDGASVHPREVVKLALAKNAAAVLCAHPHPSGVAEPSKADELITQRLKHALDLVDIRVLDHRRRERAFNGGTGSNLSCKRSVTGRPRPRRSLRSPSHSVTVT